MIILANAIFSFPATQELGYVLKYRSTTFLIAISIILIIFLIFFYVLSVVAFFKYVIEDSIKTKFAKFYVNALMVSCIVFLLIEIVLTVSVFLVKNIWVTDYAGIFMGIVVGIVMNVLLFFWAKNLNEAMGGCTGCENEVKENIVDEKEAAAQDNKVNAPESKPENTEKITYDTPPVNQGAETPVVIVDKPSK